MSKKYLRQVRKFSPSLKKQIVGLIESGKLSVAAATREYSVSHTSIYRWINRYSTYNKTGCVLTIDKNNQTEKIKALQEKISELEQAVGHKQMKLDYYEKFVEIASDEVDVDLKKKYASKLSGGSSKTNKNTSGR
ncbi:MAG: transposase [Balneolales bacterium]